MKEEWNRRAKESPFYYVASFSRDWSDESFYEWGEIQTQIIVDEFFKNLHVDTSDLVMLEIGCGAGRMTRALASRFRQVFAYDVSEEYVRVAKEKNAYLKNVVFAINDGASFPNIGDNSLDFVFSGWTMQHMPSKEVIIKNIEEMARMLKPEGFYKIDPRVAEHSQAVENIVSRLVHSTTIRSLAALFGLDKMVVSPTWRGARFREREIRDTLIGNGLSVHVTLENDGLDKIGGKTVLRRWFHGKKSVSCEDR
jgi:SAM-dependent methyltransferase